MRRLNLLLILLAIFCCSSSSCLALDRCCSLDIQRASKSENNGLLIMFWNLENFFDYKDSGDNFADAEFSSFGSRRWTKKRFYKKCSLISKSILWVAEEYGKLPDVIGVAEIENKFVLQRLIYSTVLRKCGYKIVHYDSPDKRGIDTALLYRGGTLNLKSKGKFPIKGSRDIVYANFCVPNVAAPSSLISFLVNHHPSKYGGKASEPRRKYAIKRLRALGDSLSLSGINNIVAMGDFNDTPDNPAYEMLKPLFHNKSEKLFKEGQGTIRFAGKWDLIDMFWVTTPLIQVSEMEIIKIPFLITRDKTNVGDKPLRTYSGPRYLGGVSDHCPIIMRIR